VLGENRPSPAFVICERADETLGGALAGLSVLFLYFQNADSFIELRAASKQNDLIAGLEFFV